MDIYADLDLSEDDSLKIEEDPDPVNPPNSNESIDESVGRVVGRRRGSDSSLS